MQRLKSEYYIKVGIKKGKVVEVDWSEMAREEIIVLQVDAVNKVLKYLKEYIEFLTRDKKEKNDNGNKKN